MKRIRKSISTLEIGSYAKDYGEQDLKDYLDCSNGINPFGIPERVRKDIQNISAEMVNQYPHSSNSIKRAITDYWKGHAHIEQDQILLGDGSIELIYKINKLFIEPGSQVLGFSPQFPDFINDVLTSGGEYHELILGQEQYCTFFAEDYLDRMEDKISLYYIDNPNNPTGQVIELPQIEAIVQKAKELGTPVIIDEAYGDFISRERSAVNLLDDYDNLTVLRSFSKGMGLAGLRAGYILTSIEIAGYYKRISNPYEMNAVSRYLCQSALEDTLFIQSSVEKIRVNKKRVMEHLQTLIPLTSDPDVPILTLIHPDTAVDLQELFLNEKILTVSGKSFRGLGKNAVRLMINADIERLIQGLASVEMKISIDRRNSI